MKILVANPFGIGDVIFSTPLLEELKRNYPASYIGYVCNKRAYEVIKSNPNINKIFVYEKDDFRATWKVSKNEFFKKLFKFLKLVKSERFDIAIDLSLNYQCSLCLMLIGLPNRVGFNYRKRGKFLTRRIDIDGFSDKHVVEYYLDTIKLMGMSSAPSGSRPRVYITETDRLWARQFLANYMVDDKDLVVGVIPGCGASWGVDARHRRWNLEALPKYVMPW